MIREFNPGDVLVFQIESGFCLLRILGVESSDLYGAVWHVRVYGDFFPDVKSAEKAIEKLGQVKVGISHTAVTDRAFLSTQAGLLKNVPLDRSEIGLREQWRSDPDRRVSDHSVRLLLGLR